MNMVVVVVVITTTLLWKYRSESTISGYQDARGSTPIVIHCYGVVFQVSNSIITGVLW